MHLGAGHAAEQEQLKRVMLIYHALVMHGPGSGSARGPLAVKEIEDRCRDLLRDWLPEEDNADGGPMVTQTPLPRHLPIAATLDEMESLGIWTVVRGRTDAASTGETAPDASGRVTHAIAVPLVDAASSVLRARGLLGGRTPPSGAGEEQSFFQQKLGNRSSTRKEAEKRRKEDDSAKPIIN